MERSAERGVGRRRGWTLSVLAGVAVVALASTAWACTMIMGPVRVCSPSTGTCSDTTATPATEGRGAEGSIIKVRAWGLKKKPAKYALYMGPGHCHDETMAVLKDKDGVELTAMKTNTKGELDRDLSTAALEPYKARLPEVGTVPGDYSWGICAQESYPVIRDSATNHARFTIVVI